MSSENLSLKRKVLFTSIIAGLLIGFVEILLQGYYFLNAGDFLFRRHGLPINIADEIRGYASKPNLEYRHATNEFDYTIFTNDQGYRTGSDRPHYAYEKDADTYRIIAMGPSFTFGWANDYEYIYPTLIGEKIRVPGKKVEVINVGTGGQGTIAQSCWLEREGYKFQPDLVLMTSYGSTPTPMGSGCPEGGVRPAIVVDGHLHLRQPSLALRARSFFKNFAVVFYSFYVYTALGPEDEATYVDAGKELYSDEERSLTDDKGLVDSYLAFQNLFADKIGSHGDLVFLHIPMSFMVHPNDVKRWAGLVDFGERGVTGFRQTTQRQLAALREGSVEIVDTTPELIRRAEQDRVFFWLDIHLTETGNEAVTDAMMPTLQNVVDLRYGGRGSENSRESDTGRSIASYH